MNTVWLIKPSVVDIVGELGQPFTSHNTCTEMKNGWFVAFTPKHFRKRLFGYLL
jgi:hypothetical protein